MSRNRPAGSEGPSSDPAERVPTSTPASASLETQPVLPFHVVGRFDDRDPTGLRVGFPGTEIRARFSGSALAIDLADSGASRWSVAIGGATPTDLVVTGERVTYEVASGLDAGEHDVVLTKQTETFTGVTQFFGFVGTLVPTPAPTGKRIEFIGDSITCGYGVLGANGECGFSANTESEPFAWGALASKELGALHTVTAVSGIGVLRNFDGSTTETMPARYDRALADDPASTWTHSKFEPDVVVVNLGTNDFAGGKGDPGTKFEAAYVKLLADLRAKHAGAAIVATTSPMLSDANWTKHRTYVASAIAKRKAAGDAAVSLLDLSEQDEHDGFGCDYHPSAVTQRKMALRLAQYLKNLLRW